MFKPNRRHPADTVVLNPTAAGTLESAVDRLRSSGLSRNQAASELLRSQIYDWAEDESDAGGKLPRLRSAKD